MTRILSQKISAISRKIPLKMEAFLAVDNIASRTLDMITLGLATPYKVWDKTT